jgi:hypothetical protein
VRHIRAGRAPRDFRACFLTAVLNAAREHLRTEASRRRREASMGVVSRARERGQTDHELIQALGVSLADYGNKCLHWKTGQGLGAAEQILASEDGTMYVLYYGKTYPNGQVFRISKDRSKVEEIVRCVDGGKDGPGLKTGWHCGPLFMEAVYKDIVILSSVDSNNVRRWKDGRVSTLCADDGEWREIYGVRGSGKRGFVGKGFSCVPRSGHVYLHYPGEERGGIAHMYEFGPVDFLEPTVGPPVGGQ